MADFVNIAGTIQNPDILGSYLRGQVGAQLVQAGQQQLQAGSLDIDKLRMALKQQGLTMDLASRLAGQAGGAQNAGGPSGGMQNGPQDQVSHQSPGNPAQPSMSGSYDGSTGSTGGLPVNTMMALDILQGRDPLKTAQGAQEYEQKQRQLQAQGPLSLLDSIASSASPGRILMNNPGLMQRWQQLAPQLGFDPVNDFKDENIRQAVGFARNQVAGAAGLPIKPMPTQMQQIKGPNGQMLSRDPITGEIKQEVGEESLHSVIGADGKPVLLPASQAAGKTPYNQSIFGAANLSDDTKELAYQFARTNGGQLPAWLNSRGDAAKSAISNYIAQRAKSEGDTALSMVAQGQATKAAGGVVNDFTKGKSAQSLNGINTAVQHMDALEPLIDKLNNTGTPIFNKAANFFKQQTGQAAPTNFAALKEFVGGEVAKAVLPGGGGESERQALTAPLNAANSPEQLKQAVQTIKTALAGKTEALRNQWDIGTNGTQGSFDRFLMPATKKALGIGDQSSSASDHPADIQALLSKYK